MTNPTIDPISYNAGIEAAAKVLDDAAQDWNRIRDPGMASNARSYAKKIRSLHLPEPQTAPEPYTPPQVGEPCDAEGVKSIQDAASLLRQWAKALRANSEHTVETIAIVNGICVADDLDGIADFLAGIAAPAPADAERLALAEKWPEPKVTNPDIACPTGIPYIDCLIHRLLDAQQDINYEANSRMSQSLCDASALMDEVETAIRRFSSLRAGGWRGATCKELLQVADSSAPKNTGG